MQDMHIQEASCHSNRIKNSKSRRSRPWKTDSNKSDEKTKNEWVEKRLFASHTKDFWWWNLPTSLIIPAQQNSKRLLLKQSNFSILSQNSLKQNPRTRETKTKRARIQPVSKNEENQSQNQSFIQASNKPPLKGFRRCTRNDNPWKTASRKNEKKIKMQNKENKIHWSSLGRNGVINLWKKGSLILWKIKIRRNLGWEANKFVTPKTSKDLQIYVSKGRNDLEWLDRKKLEGFLGRDASLLFYTNDYISTFNFSMNFLGFQRIYRLAVRFYFPVFSSFSHFVKNKYIFY